jgi:aryl-alcohol dehydrogenase-like predicted oxidoreductase
MTLLPRTDLDVFPLNLGCNVFGWTASREESFAVLDAYAAAGGNFLDTADVYMAGVPGNQGGESETIIGEWLAFRGRPDNFVIATKVGKLTGFKDLRPETIKAAAENSLRRLGVETIDLYYAHFDDLDTPLAETLGGFGELIEQGKVRYIAASNYSGARLAEALEIAEREGLPRYVALQPHYNLMEREFETDERPVCEREDVPVFPFYALAKGFLTGERMLSALDEISATHGVAPASVAVAWLREQPTVLAPIASARTPEQLAPLLASVELDLSADELARLTDI